MGGGLAQCSPVNSFLATLPNSRPMESRADREKKRRRAYETAETDEEAARVLKMNVHTFRSWRRARHLPMKNPKLGLKTTPEELSTVRDMLKEGASYETIAAHINAHNIGGRKWLKTPGSVAWNAFKLGIITRDQLGQWYEQRKLEKITGRSAGRDAFRSEVLRRDGNRCVVCGSERRLEIDHIVEFSLGGRNEPSNGVTLCHSCHRLKTSPTHDSSWHQFAERYAATVRKLGFRVEYGWCAEHGHHYLKARPET